MKRIYILSTVVLFLSMSSCIFPYRMTTTINENGEVTKELYYYQQGTTEKETSDPAHFPFATTSGWQLETTDSLYLYYAGKPHVMNNRATRHFQSLEHTREIGVKENLREFLTPREQLRKQFRWFYTYYTYDATFPEAKDKGKIPIQEYLTPEEIDIWLTGKNKDVYFKGMNGMEINQILQEIEGKFMTWLKRNLFEIAWDVLEKYAEGTIAPEQLQAMKVTDHAGFFDDYFRKKEYSFQEEQEASPENIAAILDKTGDTTVWTNLLNAHKSAINEEMDAWVNRLQPDQSVVLDYEVVLPGTLLKANSDFINEGVPSWRVNLTTFLMDDYRLTAQSRTANPWAFILTFLLLCGAGIVVWIRKR